MASQARRRSGTDGGNLGVADPYADVVGDLGCDAVVRTCVDERALQCLHVRPHAQLLDLPRACPTPLEAAKGLFLDMAGPPMWSSRPVFASYPIASQADHRVDDQLSRAMEGDLSASLRLEKREHT